MSIWKNSDYFLTICKVEDMMSDNFGYTPELLDYIDYEHLEVDIFCDGDDELYDNYLYCLEAVCSSSENSDNYANPCLVFRIWDDLLADYGKFNLFLY